MQIPIEVSFRGMESSVSIADEVRDRAAKLERFYPRMTSCRVIVEAAHHRHVKGTVYHVRVDITVPGREIVAEREPEPQRFHEDVYLAIRDAFDEARRELQDYARVQRGEVKAHAPRAGEEIPRANKRSPP
jgi:ribosome-associated translation inhibitor RaiA